MLCERRGRRGVPDWRPQSREGFKRLPWSFTWDLANLDKSHRIEGCTPALASGKCVPETCPLFYCALWANCWVRDSLSCNRPLQCLSDFRSKGNKVRYYLTPFTCFTGNAFEGFFFLKHWLDCSYPITQLTGLSGAKLLNELKVWREKHLEPLFLHRITLGYFVCWRLLDLTITRWTKREHKFWRPSFLSFMKYSFAWCTCKDTEIKYYKHVIHSKFAH